MNKNLSHKLIRTAAVSLALIVGATGAAIPGVSGTASTANGDGLAGIFSPEAVYAVSVGDAESPARFDEDYRLHHCLDISSWNGDITKSEWKAIKKAGVDSVIIRAGYSKLNTGRIKQDDCFETNIKRAHDAGLKIGVYYFTVALTPKEAEREAEHFVEMIRPYRSMITLPAVLDYETNSGGRLNARTVAELGPKNCTNICCTFLDIVKENGFTPMLYASRGLLNGPLDAKKLESKYLIWIAQYTNDLSATGYKGDYYMWQYSSSVRIPGVNSRFDANYLYEKKYTALEKYKDITADEPDTDDDTDSDGTNGIVGTNGKAGANGKTGTNSNDNTDGKGKTSKPQTKTFDLSANVSSNVPAVSDGASAKATVTDSEGTTHKYEMCKSQGDITEDICVLSCLLKGFDIPKDNIDILLAAASKDGDYSMDDVEGILKSANIPYERHAKSGDDSYLNIKKYLANGMPVLISIKGDDSKWGKDSHKLLLIGMDEDGRAIVADPTDREWSGDDQRIKLGSVNELADCIDKGYFLIGKTIK